MRHFGHILVVLGFGLLTGTLHAAPTIPPAAELQRLQEVIRTQPPVMPQGPVITLPPDPSPTATEEQQRQREDTRLYLEAVELRGVTQISPSELLPLFSTVTGQDTSLAEIDKTVAAISTVYRQRGLFLSRAFLPPQELGSGRLIIQVVEGRVGDITINASERVRENPFVQKLLTRLDKNNLTSQQLEHILLQLNDLPGFTAQGNLSPGASPGTTILTVTITEDRGNIGMGFSNHGTRYLGPNQAEPEVTINNILSPGGDEFTAKAVQTPNWSDVSFLSTRYQLPVNSWGTSLALDGFTGVSRPKWTLEQLDINSHTQGFGVQLTQHLTRQRNDTWDIYTRFDWSDADSTSLGNQLSEDNLRVLRVGTTVTTADSWQGITSTKLELSHGLDVFNATKRESIGASRLRGYGEGFTKGNFNISRLQRLNPVWNMLLAGGGQFADHALLAGEEFGLGGESFGRGFDSNEVVGDQGLGARLELQATFNPEVWWMHSWQLFGFYDYGMAWNKDRDPLESNNPSTLASIGYGARLQFNPGLAGEVYLAKPVTRNVLSNEDDNPTIYFRLKGSVDFETLYDLHKPSAMATSKESET